MDTTTGTLLILLVGVATVVGGILLLRLHAFLALILGALVVAVLTPNAARERFFLQQQDAEIVSDAGEPLVIATANDKPKADRRDTDRDSGVRVGDQYVLMRRDSETGRYRKARDLRVTALVPSEDGTRELAELIGFDPLLDPLQTGDIVVATAAVQSARKSAKATIGSRIAAGFGATCTNIGILIAMASIIGTALLDSGAADRIVRTMLRWFGESGAPLAFMLSSFLLGIPVFFDTVFYLMIPLGQAMRVRTGKNYLAYVLAIICGGTMTHSLVPPTPGPLFAAEALGVNLGTMIVGGCIVSLVTASAGYGFAMWANRRWELAFPERTGLEEQAAVDERDLPPFWLSILPILLPVVLIAGLTTLEELPLWSTLDSTLKQFCSTLGEKNVAVSLAAVVGLLTVVRQKRQNLKSLAASVDSSLSSAGVIILITSAGGAFGAVLQETGVASLIRGLPHGSPALMCTLAFLVTAAVRTAQGSATVAMITAAGVFADLDMGAHPVYLALAIGCGSKPIAWMNDSGFWVMTRMSGMTEREGLRYITPMTALMGVVGLLTVLLGVTLWPQL